MKKKHTCRFLPSKGCTWRCSGRSFVVCICGRCKKKR